MPEQPLTAKRQAFCQEYCIRGHNGAEAYRRAYPKCKSGHKENASRLLTFDNVKQEISRIDAESAEIGHRTVKGLDKLYQTAYDTSKDLNQPSAMVSAVTGIARLYGLDKDVQVATELPTSITVADAERYRDMADAATADNLNKPKLSKGA